MRCNANRSLLGWALVALISAALFACSDPSDAARITVVVDSGAWATQIRYLERELLDRIAELVGVDVVREVRVTVAPRPVDD